MRSLSQALAKQSPPRPKGTPVTLAPCRVVTVTPLVIDFYTSDQYPGVKIAGATYTVGPANALLIPGSTPIVLPIGA